MMKAAGAVADVGEALSATQVGGAAAGGQNRKNYIVYRYGCLEPTLNGDLMIEQMRLRRQFWNELAAAHNKWWEEYKRICWVPLHSDILESFYDEIDRLSFEIAKERQKSRSSKADNTPYVKRLKARIKVLRRAARNYNDNFVKPIRKVIVAQPHVQAQLKRITEQKDREIKQAKANSGLHWCNTDDIERNYVKYNKKQVVSRNSLLHFKRWDGNGKVNIRLKKPFLATADVFGTSQWVQIDPVPVDAWFSPIRAVRRRLSRTKIRVRIHSVGRRPVWVELPMVMHRPLPEGLIRKVDITRKVIAGKPRYFASITVEVPAVSCVRDDKKPAIGIDIGWRLKSDNTLRVCYWHDTTGAHGEVVLGPEIVSQFFKVSDLQSIRDKNFDDIREKLVDFVRNNSIPAWLRNEKYITHPKWRSIAKLVKLYKYKWQRFPGDNVIYQELENWYKRERHLYEYEANLRDQIIARRNEEYRKFAAGVVRKYGYVVLELFDLAEMAKKPMPDQGVKTSLPPNKYRFIAAPSELRNAIENACKREGILVERVNPDYTTQGKRKIMPTS
jgi:hypothetical protein